jgi:co-chaperonin GroES (HSP10)
MTNSLRMRNDNILLQILEQEKLSPGGLHLVQGNPQKQRTLAGKVLAKGPKVDDMLGDQLGLEDRVVVSSLAGQDLSYDSDGHTLTGLELGVDYRVVRADEVLCVLDDEVSYG